MYPDGLCKLDDHTWAKCIEFEDVNYQLAKADFSILLFRLAGRSGASGNPGGNGFFGVVHTQSFQTGEPFLIRRFGGDILAALDLITFSLQAAKQFF